LSEDSLVRKDYIVPAAAGGAAYRRGIWMFGVLLAVAAVGIGILASMIGVGGGFLVVPMLILGWGFSAQDAAGTSLLMIVFTSTSSTLAYWRQHRIDLPLGLALAAATLPGALVGAYLTSLLSSKILEGMLGIFLAGIAVKMFLARELPDRVGEGTSSTRRIIDAHGHVFEYSPRLSLGIPGSFLAGMTSGLFGIGGGVLVVPLLRLGLKVPMHIAAPTSMFMMIFTSVGGGLAHAALGHARVSYAIPLILGIIVGTQTGARLARTTRSKVLELILAACLMVVGLRMVLCLL